MAKRTLTDKGVKSVRSKGGKWLEIWDAKEPGLLLIVSPKGHKSFAFRYRRRSDGKKRKITIGPADQPSSRAGKSVVSLADARAKASMYRAAVNSGEDPARDIRAPKKDSVSTFRDLAAVYMRRHAKPNKRSWQADQRSLDRDVLPMLGDMTLRDISKRDVLDVLDTVADRGSPIMANRTLAIIRGVFRWAEANDYLEAAPIHGIRPPGVEHTRDRVLDAGEIRIFLEKLDTPKLTSEVQDIARLVLILGQRVSEIAGAEAAEINFDSAEWIIPAARTKNGRRHVVPLPPMAVDIFKRNIRSGERFVFPSHGKSGHVRAQAPQRAINRNREHFGLEHFTIHDLRRTAASNMAELGVDRTVIGKVLNHVSVDKDTVTGIYDRHGYLREKRIALQRWALKLDEITSGRDAEKVVKLISQ